MKTPEFSLKLGAFLGEYLPAQRNASAHTIASYGQTFILLLEYFVRRGLPATRLTLEHFTADTVMTFLRELEDARKNGIATRNLRLAALRSFSRYLLERAPERAAQWQRIITLRQKRGAQQQWIAHLDVPAMSRLLRAPDRATPWGRRDAAMLSLLYDSGARVQELITMTPEKVRLEPPAHISVEGKGRKGRMIPLLPATSALLAAYIAEWHGWPAVRPEAPLFFNHRRGRMTRSGIRWIIRKYAGRTQTASTNGGRQVSPHTFRHSKAMHLLRSNASIMELQSLLGHADVRTTMRYAHADEEMVREALQKAGTLVPDAAEAVTPPWKREPELLAWLKDLCRRTG